MAQIKRFSWTNPATAVAKNLNVGFEVAKVEIWDLTTPARLEWTADMADESVFGLGALTYNTENGVTPLAQDAVFGAKISGFTNASPGVITVNDTETFGFEAGDKVRVSGLTDNGTQNSSLNGEFTVASVTSTTITLVEDTTGYSVYVSGGTLVRVADKDGNAMPLDNQAVRGVTLGLSAVGANAASMVAICYGEE